MHKNFVITIVLAVLVVISVVQAIQLNGLKTTLAESDLSVGTKNVKVSTGSSGSSGSLPTNIQSLPTMVGGC
jgi:hypothetical protein|tara:strand:- start:204 stop:419 length:216 start_codon:yes stop_codon:yes gene_type:complete